VDIATFLGHEDIQALSKSRAPGGAVAISGCFADFNDHGRFGTTRVWGILPIDWETFL
jgi:hypothetical protein